jgi:Uma2 family endonuclease
MLIVMSATVPHRMTADEFIAWAMEQPEGKRYELVAGEVVAMAPERAEHARLKGQMFVNLREAIRAAGVDCEAFPDGMAVRVDAETIYEPDAIVRCGPAVDGNTTELVDPVIVVEVVSPSSQRRDTGSKLEGYFRIASVRHYLIVKTENRAIIHHRRDEAGNIATHIIRAGVIRLDPPGLAVAALLAA